MIDVSASALTKASPSANWILSQLQAAEHQRFLSLLHLVPLRFNQRICESGKPLRHVYFPVRGSLSLMAVMSDGNSVEVADVGNEGCCGYPTSWLVARTGFRVFVPSQGDAYRIDAECFEEELEANHNLQRVLNTAQVSLLAKLSRMSACNGLHTVMQRCCRWLLTARDRHQSNELPYTHEFLATMLGVRRPSVTDVMQPLQRKEIIHHSRGRITIVDHPALQERACECYGKLKEERERLLSEREQAELSCSISG